MLKSVQRVLLWFFENKTVLPPRWRKCWVIRVCGGFKVPLDLKRKKFTDTISALTCVMNILRRRH